MKNVKVGIIGVGKLGSALNQLLCLNGFSNKIYLSDVNGKYKSNQEVIKKCNILFLSVKPNQIRYVLEQIRDNDDNNKLVISSVAGINTKTIEDCLNSYYPIIRCMPNLPIRNGKGSIVYYMNNMTHIKEHFQFREMTEGPYSLLVRNEKLIDTSTVFTGCMPGFISFLSQEYINFAIKRGFTERESRELFCSTLRGTAELLLNDKPEDVVKDVSSPGGATEKGVEIMKEFNINKIISDSVDLAYARVRKFH